MVPSSLDVLQCLQSVWLSCCWSVSYEGEHKTSHLCVFCSRSLGMEVRCFPALPPFAVHQQVSSRMKLLGNLPLIVAALLSSQRECYLDFLIFLVEEPLEPLHIQLSTRIHSLDPEPYSSQSKVWGVIYSIPSRFCWWRSRWDVSLPYQSFEEVYQQDQAVSSCLLESLCPNNLERDWCLKTPFLSGSGHLLTLKSRKSLHKDPI